MKSENRKIQIIEATLKLLGESRVDQVTTRQIAERVGVTQPALFRHYPSREAIFAGVVQHAREQLAALAEGVIGSNGGVEEKLKALCSGLLGYIEANPGLSRILFYDATHQGDGNLRMYLQQLIAMQRALVSALVRTAIEAGELDGGVDSELAGRLWVATLQGTVLQWQLEGHSMDLSSLASPILDTWLGGIGKGCARGNAGSETVSRSANLPLNLLDVRPILAEGRDPLQNILAALSDIRPDGALILSVPFHPRPLVALLRSKGHELRVRSIDDGGIEVWILGLAAEGVLDVSDLPPPEPIQRVLEAAFDLGPQESFLAHTPRYPAPLLMRLVEMGRSCEAQVCADETALVYVNGGGS